MPIVGVNDIGTPASARLVGNFSGNVIEKCKTQRIVGPVFAIVTLIKTAAAVLKCWAIDQPDWNFGVGKMGLKKPCLTATQRVAESRDFR